MSDIVVEDGGNHLPAMLYDGKCYFCNSTVKFILRFESASARKKLQFAPLQSRGGQSLLKGSDMASVTDSFIVVDTDGKAYSHWRACLLMFFYMGGAWRLIAYLFTYIIPRSFGNFCYSLGWKYRKMILGAWEGQGCIIPGPEERSRTILSGQSFDE